MIKKLNYSELNEKPQARGCWCSKLGKQLTQLLAYKSSLQNEASI
ncbi:MAG: hypothetical protein NT076_01700 [Candidatus Pacearchaeota archaeon]|nr:hypothetical protein [Candidatus Pacearchaeota archaeon]